MIPRKLELKNFLCYGEKIQTIDFENYSLICLSGKNGNGKSALLDALTWALWGQARKVSGTIKADEGLIRVGQTRMMVCLEFQIGLRIYRVRRDFAKTYGKPYAALDFEVFDSSGNKFVSLTDKTIKLTQEKIELTVGLDFETFINSAFLKQGQSNEFSKKTPKERKQILATILGLSKYDKLQQRALDEVRKYTDEKKLLTKLQEQENQELAQETDLQNAQAHEKQELETINKAIDAKNKELGAIEQEKRTYQEQKKQHDQLIRETDTLRQKITHKHQELRMVRTTWKQVHAQSLKLPNIKKLEEEKWTLVKKEKGFIELQQKSLTLQEEILRHKDLHQKHTNTLKQQHETQLYNTRLNIDKKTLEHKHLHDALLHHQKELTTLIKQESTTGKELVTIDTTLQQETQFTQKYECIKAQFEKRRTFYQMLIQQGNHIKNDLKELEQKKAVAHDQTNPSCPLCQQVLTAKRKQYLSTQFIKQESFSAHRLQRITNLVKKLKDLLVEQHNDVQQLVKEADLYTQLRVKQADLITKHAQFTREITDKEKQCSELIKQEQEYVTAIQHGKEELIKQEATSQTILNKDQQTLELIQAITILEQKKATFAFDADEYSRLQAQVKKLEQDLQRLETIKQDLDKQNEKKHVIIQLCRELKELSLTLLAYQSQLKQHTFNPDQLGILAKTIIDLEQHIQVTRTLKDSLIHKIGSLENELRRLETLKIERKKRAATLQKIDDECEDSMTLAHAFSKNGIQALLIEEAIPEVEEEANIILSQLTNNQSHVFIESLRDLKSGGVKETLDIKIADSIGIRPYEMFSGGEAFRIDFALRIAISKLLARRAGTSLQTLIIDEGFGSQDDEGLAHLMTALHSIQHDFLKVIIVSHLAEFKDNFPVHFVVEKEPTGSVIRVEERG